MQELQAAFHGVKWRAPSLDGEGGCSEEQRDTCRNEFGEDNLAWTCERCKRRSA